LQNGQTSLEKELVSSQFTCATSNNCPENVGLIFANKDGKKSNPQLFQCTGFLVADDIVATNSHCIPELLKTNPGENCADFLAIRFFDSASKTKVFSCASLIDFSNYKVDSLAEDFAFFKVKSTKIKPFQMGEKTGIQDNQNISIAKVSPLKLIQGGELSVQSCNIVLNSLLNTSAKTPFAKTASAIGCKVIKGNSGSPVLNSNNQAIGIVQSYWNDDFADVLNKALKNYEIKVPSDLGPDFIFTNFSCVDDPVSQTRSPKTCTSVDTKPEEKDQNVLMCKNHKNTELEQNFTNQTKSFELSLPKIFDYSIVQIQDNNGFIAIPKCIKTSSQIDDYSSYINKDELRLQYGGIMTNIKEKVYLDSGYRISSCLENSANSIENVKVYFKKSELGWKGFVSPSKDVDTSEVTKSKEVTIEECKSEQI
jgi:hypothetical protein